MTLSLWICTTGHSCGMNATGSLLPALLRHGQGEPPPGAAAAGGTSWAWPQAPGEVTRRADGGPVRGGSVGTPGLLTAEQQQVPGQGCSHGSPPVLHEHTFLGAPSRTWAFARRAHFGHKRAPNSWPDLNGVWGGGENSELSFGCHFKANSHNLIT